MAFIRCTKCALTKPAENSIEDPRTFVCQECQRQDQVNRDIAIQRWAETLPNRFLREIRKASDEGRLHPDIAHALSLPTGSYRCPICGMLHREVMDADLCCVPGLDLHQEIMAEAYARRDRGDTRKRYEIAREIQRAM